VSSEAAKHIRRAIEQAGQSPAEFLHRHVRGDWGELCDEDRELPPPVPPTVCYS